MNKSELVAAVAQKSEVSKKDTEKVVSALFETIVDAIASGDKVQVVGFGLFEQRERSARVGSDPRTGAKIDIPASKVPAFKAGKAFKDAVNK